MFPDRRSFVNFFFQWTIDRNTRLVFSIVPDITGRNIRPFGKSLIHYPRWVEAGYLVELMRLTDFINSLPLDRRQQLSDLARLNLTRPSESLIDDLWELAKAHISIEDFRHKYHRTI